MTRPGMMATGHARNFALCCALDSFIPTPHFVIAHTVFLRRYSRLTLPAITASSNRILRGVPTSSAAWRRPHPCAALPSHWWRWRRCVQRDPFAAPAPIGWC